MYPSGFLLIKIDPLVDFIRVRAVIGDRCLDKTQWHLQITCRLGSVSAVVADSRDHFPHVLPGPHKPGAPAGRTLGKPDKRMLIHPQSFFDITLCQSARRQVHTPGAGTEALDRRVSQADAQRMTHVIHSSTVSYRLGIQLFSGPAISHVGSSRTVCSPVP